MTTPPTVSVRGEATIVVEPELATLTITVQAQAGDRRAAMDVLSRRSQAVADLVTQFAAGIEQSETSRLHVYPDLDHKKTEKVRRYIGRTSTSLVVHDFAVLSDLIVGAGSIDLVSIDGPWWRLRRDSDVYRQARLAAAADALTRARDYAAAFGAELVGLVEIADEGMSHQHEPPRPMGEFMAQAGSRMHDPESVSFDLQPGRQQVTGQVEARFLLTQPDLTSVVPAAGPSA
ncbi:MAG: SIMPL domain-containing protein [Nocardioidaceae bacterium]